MARCTVIKVPHPKREGSPVLLLQNYPQLRFYVSFLFEGKSRRGDGGHVLEAQVLRKVGK